MNEHERQIIESLFARLRQVERHGPAREPEAERLIHDQVQAQPSAAYYLVQTVIAQEQALEAAEARINDLERDVYSRGGGGFLGGLSGGRSHSYRSSPHQSYRAGPVSVPTGRHYGYGSGMRPRAASGSFLAGAAHTAIGVAGGVVVGNRIAGAFTGQETASAPPPDDDFLADDLPEDSKGLGGDFGIDEF